MTVETLHRVMWRMRKRNPEKVEVLKSELKRAIMYECGTDPKTYTSNRKALKALGWIQVGENKQRVRMTGKDLSEAN